MIKVKTFTRIEALLRHEAAGLDEQVNSFCRPVATPRSRATPHVTENGATICCWPTIRLAGSGARDVFPPRFTILV
jgi:hypothetical protein